MAKLVNECCMPCTMPRRLTRTFAGSFVLAISLRSASATLPRSSPDRRHVDVGDALDLVMIDLGGAFGCLPASRPHRAWWAASGSARAAECCVRSTKLWMAGSAVLVILDGEEVVVAGLVIHPVVRRDHGVRIQRGDDVVDDFFLRQAEFAGMHAVDIHAQRRDNSCPAECRPRPRRASCGSARPDPARRCKLRCRSRLVTCTSIGAGMPDVEDGVHHGAALEEGAHIREIGSAISFCTRSMYSKLLVVVLVASST